MRVAVILGLLVALCAVAAATPEPKHEPCALVVVIDRSIAADKLDAIRRAVAAGIDKLDRSDQLAIVGFAERARVYAPLQSVRKRAQLAKQMASIPSGDGVNVVAGLDAAFGVLKNTKLANKQVLVITDGTSLLGIEPLAARMRGDKITISALGYQSLNRGTLESIAGMGGGRHHLVDDEAALTKAMVADVNVKLQVEPWAVVFVIDRSGSMKGAKLELAKEIARSAAEILAHNDMLGVVAVDFESALIGEVTLASNRMRISTEISRIQPGGGSNLYAGLKQSFEILQPVGAFVKHVIVLSDGQSPSDGVAELVHDMHAAGITVSAVGVQGADRNLLALIADAGAGRLYMAEDIGALPKLLITERRP